MTRNLGPRLSRSRGSATADAVLAALVVAAVVLMVVPLPTWLLDVLLASNLAISVAVLLVALHVGNPLRIATFPSLLLLATLIRLALNVSSTRLILLQADAGQVIRAFGEFVVSGNHVVGAVVFLTLAIIQFIVIAKGSERVAEVGARFTLDAMPGRQMAIDAELRSGTIDGPEAQRRRQELNRESQFYGAMDGAMKFVKGDVIASFLITLINIFGGLGIGILQKNMEPMAALKRYGLLTIGDGLVTQIPALVLATAAGIVVTRVASEQVDAPLGSELASQLFGEPRALRTASIFVVLLALVPGLPALPFLVIGTLLFAASRARARQLRRDDHERALEPVTPQSPGGPMRFLPVVVPWGLEVSEDLAHLIEDELRGTEVARMGLLRASAAMRETLFTELGVPLPAGRIRSADELPEGHAVLCIHEVPATVIVVPAGKRGAAAVAHVIGEVLPVLRDRAADFLGIAETQALVERLAQLGPAAVREVVPKPVSLPLLCDILRRLLEEGVSIRDLKSILQVLAHAAKTETDPLTLTELVRAELRRPITHGLTRGKHELPVYLLEPQIEEAIRGAIARTSAGSFLTLAPGASRDIVAALEKAIGNHAAALPPVVLTQPDIRRFVRKLVETELPEVKVVSYAELLPEVALKPLGKAVIGVT